MAESPIKTFMTEATRPVISTTVSVIHTRPNQVKPFFEVLYDTIHINNENASCLNGPSSGLAHKISQNEANIPELFQNYLVKVSDIHSHNTRYASNLNFHVPRVRSNYGKHTFKFAITETWEEIPTKIKTLSYHKVKKEYKRILVNSQR